VPCLRKESRPCRFTAPHVTLLKQSKAAIARDHLIVGAGALSRREYSDVGDQLLRLVREARVALKLQPPDRQQNV
jgi:hypothetical protein